MESGSLACPYLVKYSPDLLKKKAKVLDTFNTDKTCFIKIGVEFRYSIATYIWYGYLSILRASLYINFLYIQFCPRYSFFKLFSFMY